MFRSTTNPSSSASLIHATRHSVLATAVCKSPHQYPFKGLTIPLFSYSCALFRTTQETIPNRFYAFRTLCAKHPGWGSRLATRHSFTLSGVEEPLATIFPRINTCKTASKQTTLTTFRMNTYAKPRGEGLLLLTRMWESHSWLSSWKFHEQRRRLTHTGLHGRWLIASLRMVQCDKVRGLYEA